MLLFTSYSDSNLHQIDHGDKAKTATDSLPKDEGYHAIQDKSRVQWWAGPNPGTRHFSETIITNTFLPLNISLDRLTTHQGFHFEVHKRPF
jgi:hypothetical protein